MSRIVPSVGRSLGLGIVALGLLVASPAQSRMRAETPRSSAGSERAGRLAPPRSGSESSTNPTLEEFRPAPGTGAAGTTFNGPGFDDNLPVTGSFWTPGNPTGAVGTDRVVATVSTMIEGRTRAGALLFRNSLRVFFSACLPTNHPFDPKVIWDHDQNRFVVVALERVDAGANPSSENSSRILLAVSKGPSPASLTLADWWFTCLDGEFDLGGVDFWSDAPGFELDEQALYVTANLFAHPGAPAAYGGSRVWVVDKGVSGGFYSGSPPAFSVSNPYASSGIATTTVPALVFGASGAGPGIGTFLVSYSGLTDGVSEYAQVMRIDDPLGTAGGPFFVGPEMVDLGDIERLGAELPAAPQLGGPEPIDTFDRRACDAVWRNGRLWLTTTIVPDGSTLAALPDHATAYWIELDTGAVTSSASPAGLVTLTQQGAIPGEDLASPPGGAVCTFFPAVAVNEAGAAVFGFAASGPSIHVGAYATSRTASDPPGFTAPASPLMAGRAYYLRTFDAPPCELTPVRNRWGDYSGIALDPIDDGSFWVFNQYAELRGSGTTGGCALRPGIEDGRWGTVWAVQGVGSVLATRDGPESDEIALGRVIPNPSGGPLTIEYALPRAARVTLGILDVQGHVVATLVDGLVPAGSHRATWSGRIGTAAAPAGIYFARLGTPGRNRVERVIVIR